MFRLFRISSVIEDEVAQIDKEIQNLLDDTCSYTLGVEDNYASILRGNNHPLYKAMAKHYEG